MFKIVLIVSSLFVIGGCILLPIPHEEYIQPRVTGIVLDGENRLPITGAKITLNDSIYTVTNDIGEIVISSISEHKTWMLISMDPSISEITISITHPEYDKKSITRIKSKKVKTIDFGKIFLNKPKQ